MEEGQLLGNNRSPVDKSQTGTMKCYKYFLKVLTTHRLCLVPQVLFHRVDIQWWQCELEVRAQVLVNIDVGTRGHCNGW